MAERLNSSITVPRYALPEELTRKIFGIRELRPVIAEVVTSLMSKGWNPTYEERKMIHHVVREVLRGENVSFEEIAACYESIRSKITVSGLDNIPRSGSTIFLGNHNPGGPLHGMLAYFETARVVAEARRDIDGDKKKPRLVMQRGLTKTIRTPFGQREIVIPLSPQYHELVAKSLNGVLVDPPRFDGKRQIVNHQKFPPSAYRGLMSGGAWILYPQGTNRRDYIFPEKMSDFLSGLKSTGKNINLVPVIVEIQRENRFYLKFGMPVHIKDLQSSRNGRVDINKDFVEPYLLPLIAELAA